MYLPTTEEEKSDWEMTRNLLHSEPLQGYSETTRESIRLLYYAGFRVFKQVGASALMHFLKGIAFASVGTEMLVDKGAR